MADSPITLRGQDVGSLFVNTVQNIQEMMASRPKGSVGSVDIEVTFKSLQLEDKGVHFVWSREQSNQSSLEIRLATRVYTNPQGEWEHTRPVETITRDGKPTEEES